MCNLRPVSVTQNEIVAPTFLVASFLPFKKAAYCQAWTKTKQIPVQRSSQIKPGGAERDVTYVMVWHTHPLDTATFLASSTLTHHIEIST